MGWAKQSLLNLDVTVDDGKYRFTQDKSGHVEVFRYGEPWIIGSFAGVNMVIAMACEIEELREGVKVCLDAERERQTKLRPGAPASTYTAERIAKLERLVR